MSETTPRAGIWNVLHDGSITAIEGTIPGDLAVTIDIPYLRRGFSTEGDSFILTLRECTLFHEKTASGEIEASLGKIVAAEHTILSTESNDRPVNISTTAGQLEISFSTFEIVLDDGHSVTYEEICEASRKYWDDWKAEHEAYLINQRKTPIT